MSAHKPANLPLRPRIKSTVNLRPAGRIWTNAQNQTAQRVVEYLHDQILQNPERSQRYLFKDVAAALGVEPRKVRLSLAEAGVSWISVEVRASDRATIKMLAKNSKRRPTER